MSASLIPETLLKAYKSARYRVADRGMAFELVLDRECTDLLDLYARFRLESALFITAWNPRSEVTAASANELAQAALFEELKALALPIFAGTGEDRTGKWPPEPSYLVLGISESAASQLGRQFGQNAILFAGSNAAPKLKILRW
jgi:hypothetical protein